jgi:hypothetical protein
MKRATRVGLMLVCFVACWTPRAASGIHEICETGLVAGNAGTLRHLDPNDTYMRYMDVEYMGHAETASDGLLAYERNFFVLGWVTGPDDVTGERDFNYAVVKDHGGNPCFARAMPELSSIGDVNWVHGGGHVPAGRAGTESYLSQGYLVWSALGTEYTWRTR